MTETIVFAIAGMALLVIGIFVARGGEARERQRIRETFGDFT